MRKTFTSILALMAIMFATTASAQKTYYGSVEQKVTSEYETTPIVFSLSDIAGALETDTTTLAAAFAAKEADRAGEADLFYLITESGNYPNETTGYTANGVSGFWMDANSKPAIWGQGALWFEEMGWDAAADELYFSIGQYPDANKIGDKFSAKLRLIYNQKAVDFILGLSVVENPAANIVFGGSVMQEVTEEYETTPVTFSLANVAEWLDTDAATLAAAFDAKEENRDDASTDLFFLVAGDKVYPTDGARYTANGISGYWLDAESVPCAWGGSAKWFEELRNWDVETDALSFYIGQYPNANKLGNFYYTTVRLTYGEKSVDFCLALNVSDGTYEIDLPEPPKVLEGIHEEEITADEFTIVGNVTEKTEIYSSTYKTVSVDLSKIFDALGVDAEALAENIGKTMYAYSLDDSDQDNSKKSTTLSRKSTANAPGFWMYALEDENTGDYSKELLRHAWNMSVPGMYYQEMKFDAETMTLSGTLGMNETTAIGENWLMNLYMVVGGKALQITLDNTITKMETVGMDDLKIVGESHIAIRHTDGCPDSSVDNNIDAIAEALGCSASELIFKVKGDAESLTESHTANKGGNWMTVEGYSVAWNTTGYAMYVEPAVAGDWSTINYGFNHAAYNEVELGTVFDVQLYYIYEDKAYIVHLDVTHDAEKVVDPNEAVCVRTIERTLQLKVSPEKYFSGNVDLNLESISALLETSTPTFYGEKIDAEGNVSWNKAYNCTDESGKMNGFWMAGQQEGQEYVYIGAWGSSASFAICYKSNGTLDMYQYPGTKEAGTVYKANFYLQNADNFKYIKYVFTIQYVDEVIPEIEIAGTEDLTLAACGDDGYGVYTEVDLSKMLETLGCTIEEFNEGGTWLAKDENGILSEANFDDMEGFFFTEEGTTIGDGTEAIRVGYSVDEEKFFSWIIDTANQNKEYKVEIVAEYNGVRYMFYITISNEGNGIANVAADKDASQLYDLTGRKVAAPTKGIYIKNGQKFLVK